MPSLKFGCGQTPTEMDTLRNNWANVPLVGSCIAKPSNLTLPIAAISSLLLIAFLSSSNTASLMRHDHQNLPSCLTARLCTQGGTTQCHLTVGSPISTANSDSIRTRTYRTKGSRPGLSTTFSFGLRQNTYRGALHTESCVGARYAEQLFPPVAFTNTKAPKPAPTPSTTTNPHN